jgi:hypothetical protein
MTTDSAAAILLRTLPGASRAAPRCSTWLLAAAATATPFATLREDLRVTLLDYPNVLDTSRANARALGLDLPAAERAGRVAFIEGSAFTTELSGPHSTVVVSQLLASLYSPGLRRLPAPRTRRGRRRRSAYRPRFRPAQPTFFRCGREGLRFARLFSAFVLVWTPAIVEPCSPRRAGPSNEACPASRWHTSSTRAPCPRARLAAHEEVELVGRDDAAHPRAEGVLRAVQQHGERRDPAPGQGDRRGAVRRPRVGLRRGLAARRPGVFWFVLGVGPRRTVSGPASHSEILFCLGFRVVDLRSSWSRWRAKEAESRQSRQAGRRLTTARLVAAAAPAWTRARGSCGWRSSVRLPPVLRGKTDESSSTGGHWAARSKGGRRAVERQRRGRLAARAGCCTRARSWIVRWRLAPAGALEVSGGVGLRPRRSP